MLNFFALSIFHFLYERNQILTKEKDTGVRLHYSSFKFVFESSGEFDEMLTLLQEKSLIIKCECIQGGKIAVLYKIHSKIANDNCFIVEFPTGCEIARKLKRRFTSDYYSKQQKVLNTSLQLTVEGQMYLQDKYGFPNYNSETLFEKEDLALISIFERQSVAIRPDATGRVYHTLSSMNPRDIRYVRFHGRPIIDSIADIPGEMIFPIIPGIVSKYHEMESNKHELASQLERNRNVCEANEFFGSTKNESSLFRKVITIVIDDHQPNPTEFRKYLERIEASIIIDSVFEKMCSMGSRVFTFHKAIVCSSNAELKLAEQLIKNAINKYHSDRQLEIEERNQICIKKRIERLKHSIFSYG
ncbi:MAG TPA: hypothetical protein VGB63_07565 [Pedobacter sp.]|jgi:hypothetical protein